MLVTNQKSVVRVTKLENYGSELHPLYTIGVAIELRVDENA